MNVFFFQNYEADLKADVPGVFDDSTELGKSRWGDLKKRVVEHNIRIMATYYTKISLKRMAFLLSLTEAEAEDFLSTMVLVYVALENLYLVSVILLHIDCLFLLFLAWLGVIRRR